MHKNIRLQLISRVLVFLTVLIASSVVYGWICHDLRFVKLASNLPPMVFNPALFFILYSLNFVLDRKKFFVQLSILNILLLVFSLLTIAQYAIPTDFGIDELFLKDTFRMDLTHPGRMGPNTAFGFIVFSLAFLFKPKKYVKFHIHNIFPLVFFAFPVLIGLMSLLGYFFSAEKGYIWGSFTRLAIQTGICFLFFGTASIIDYLQSLRYLNEVAPKTIKLIIGVVGSVICSTIALWFVFCSMDAHKVNEIVRSEDEHIQGNITLSLKNKIDSLERLAKRFEAGIVSEKNWEIEANLLVKHFEGLDGLYIIDNNSKIRFFAEDETVKINFSSLLNSPVLIDAVQLSQKIKEPIYSSSYLDSNGKGAFFAVVPIYKNNIYNGTLVGHFSGETFFKDLLSKFDLLISIKNNNILLYTNITHETPVIYDWSFPDRINFLGLDLTVTITPAKKIIASHLGVTPTIILIIGVFLSVFMAAFVASIHELNVARNKFSFLAEWQRAILNGTDLGIVSTDADGNIILMNPAAEHILGHSEKDVIRKLSPLSWHKEEEVIKKAEELTKELGREVKPGFETFFIKSILGLPNKAQWTMYHKSGTARQVILTIYPIRNSEGVIDSYAGIIDDITDREIQQKLIEDQRFKMIASSKMSSLGEMAAGIAHEINNPLTIIKGMANIQKLSIESADFDSEMFKSSPDKIETTVDRIAKIIGSLKAFARESGTEDFSSFNISKIFDDTIPFCAERFKNSNIELKISVPDDLYILCRPVQISQVLLNLLNNAYDAIHPMSVKWVDVKAMRIGNKIEISVTDSGPGISEEIESKIMQPFFTTKDIGKGTGLGLSISAGIIDSHKGRLYYDRKSANTRFVIELPNQS